MRSTRLRIQKVAFTTSVFLFFCFPLVVYGDISFDGGATAEINYFVDGSVWVFDATVSMYEPAHIQGFVITGSGAVLDIYGGQIDTILMISSHDNTLPEGVVTVYGTDFAVDGVPVAPDTTELFLNEQNLSGVYQDGTPFAFPVSCIIEGNGNLVYYQTVKLGWIASQPDIELSVNKYDFGQTYVTDTQTGTVTIYNLGDAALTVQSVSIQDDNDNQFSIPWLPLPFTIDPNTGVDVEVSYTPVVEGSAAAKLVVFSDDPNDPYVTTDLVGEGVPLPPEQQIQNILKAYDIDVAEGSVVGVGNGNSAANKVKTFGKMLLIVNGLIEAGYYDDAFDPLLVIEAKCDGGKSPKDFIEGPATEELNAQINKLIDTLQE